MEEDVVCRKDNFALLKGRTDIKALKLTDCSRCPPELWAQTQLQHLEFEHCTIPASEAVLHKLGRLQQLRHLHLADSDKLTALPATVAQITALEQLALVNCSLAALPAAIGQMQLLQKLDLTGCSSLQQLPQQIGQLVNLQKLLLGGCGALDALDPALCHCLQLQELDLTDCSSLQQLPQEIGQLTNLQKLLLGGCTALQNLSSALCQCLHLKHLDLSSCASLDMLLEQLVRPPLQRLDLTDCSSLRQLPENPGQLTGLQSLLLRECTALQALDASVCSCLQLTELDFSGCSSLETLPVELGQLRNLHKLTISGKHLATLPDSICHLTALEHLVINECHSLDRLPDSMGELVGLETLELLGCKKLDALPESVGQLTKLTNLTLTECGTKLLPARFVDMQSLRQLRLCELSLDSLPEKLGQLVQLRDLVVNKCSRLKSLPDSIQQLRGLTRLSVSDCSSLESLPAGLWYMPALQVLCLVDFSSLTHSDMPVLLGAEGSLRKLTLSGCSKLARLPSWITGLEALTCLELDLCSSLAFLPEVLQLTSLQELNLTGCRSLKQLPQSLGQLTVLSRLDLEMCSSLAQLPTFMGGMKGLQILNLRLCGSLNGLPRTMPRGLCQLDLSYCSHKDTLAVKLVDLAEQMPDVKVTLLGWNALLGGQSGCESTPLYDRKVMPHLRTEAIVVKLLTDKDAFISSLERLSWLAVLLAATTFTGAIAPPGGYDNGRLFMAYSASDCGSSSSSSVAYSSITNCTVAATSSGSCPIGVNDINGACIQAPDICSNGLACKAQPREYWLRQFFLLDLLSFGFSMALVLFVVASSMPRRIDSQAAKFAGIIWLTFVTASALMALAVGLGVGALVAGILAVYPAQYVANDVYTPLYVMLALMSCAFWGLLVRWFTIFPGWAAVIAALSHIGKSIAHPVTEPLLWAMPHVRAGAAACGRGVLRMPEAVRAFCLQCSATCMQDQGQQQPAELAVVRTD